MESLDSFEYEISMYYNLSSSLIFDAASFIQLLLYGNYKEKETLNNRFKAISNDGSGAKHFQCKKNIPNWEKFNFLFLWSTLESFILKKNPVVPADFVINRFTVSIMLFYSDSMSAIVRFYGCIMAEVWITEYSGFMKDFLVPFTTTTTFILSIIPG